jgi:hypothetical protein
MKKNQNLKFANLGKSLGKSQQQGIRGAGSCQAYIQTEFGYTVLTGLSARDAKSQVTKPGEKWCCDSCSSASWAQK